RASHITLGNAAPRRRQRRAGGDSPKLFPSPHLPRSREARPAASPTATLGEKSGLMLEEHSRTLDDHTSKLNEVIGTVNEHSRRFDEVAVAINSQGRRLDDIAAGVEELHGTVDTYH